MDAWHKKNRKLRGSASQHWCIACWEKHATGWATVHGSNPYQYVPMCHQCHMLYDAPIRNLKIAAAMRVRIVSDATRAKLRQTALLRPPMPQEARAKISAVHRGKPWTPARRAAHERRRAS